MFAMADGGRDLEAYQVAGYDQARSALLQVRGRPWHFAWVVSGRYNCLLCMTSQWCR
jgi:hypothetical protein